MSAFTRSTAIVLIVTLCGSVGRGEDQPEKQWVWLASQGVWAFGYQIQDGPHRGLWRIDPGTKSAPADPYGFAGILNRYRAEAGLGSAVYDPALSEWAVQNNAAQCSQGLGHHVNPGCHQNSGWNQPDAETIAADWMNSPGHRETMLLPTMTRFGIAFGPGPYWTLNAQ